MANSVPPLSFSVKFIHSSMTARDGNNWTKTYFRDDDVITHLFDIRCRVVSINDGFDNGFGFFDIVGRFVCFYGNGRLDGLF